MIELKYLQKYSIHTSSFGAWMQADNEGVYCYVKDVESLLMDDIPLVELTPTLKNDSKRHDMVFKETNITYRLSVKKSHFWIYNRDTGQEIQYINHDNGLPECYCNGWESFIEEEWDNILEDMR